MVCMRLRISTRSKVICDNPTLGSWEQVLQSMMFSAAVSHYGKVDYYLGPLCNKTLTYFQMMLTPSI